MSNKTKNVIFMLMKWTFLIWHHVFDSVWLIWVRKSRNIYLAIYDYHNSKIKLNVFYISNDQYILIHIACSYSVILLCLNKQKKIYLTNKNNFYLASTPHPWFPCIIDDALSQVIKRTSFIWILSYVV